MRRLGKLLSLVLWAIALLMAGTSLLPAARADDAVTPKDPGAPSGNGVQPVWLPGLPACANLAPEGRVWHELVADPVTGTYSDGLLAVAIELQRAMGGEILGWQGNPAPSAVLVHSAGDTNFYEYDPALAAPSDTFLHAPVELNGPSFLPVASISFCYQAPPEDPGPPSAAGVQPVWQSGSPTCSVLAPAGTTWHELRVDPVADGTYGDGELHVSIDRLDTLGGQALDWRANIAVDAVIVRDGSNSNLYTYSPPVPSTADAGLHAPVDPDAYLPRRLASISFCYQVPPLDPGPISTGGVQPVWRDDAPDCAGIAPTGMDWHQLTVEPVADGTFGDGYLRVTLDHERPLDGDLVGWSSNVAVSAVLVRGGGSSNLYTYPGSAAWHDSRLHAPVDPGTYLFYRIDQVAFCYERGPEDPGPTSGHGTQPVWKLGDSSCTDLAPAGITWRELKVEPVASGPFADGLLAVTLEHRRDMGGQSVNWSSNIGVDAVFVKGELNGNFYQYEPPAEVFGDTFLHAPVDPQLALQEIRYLSFCYDVAPSVAVELSGDTSSEAGDEVTYSVHIANDGDLPLDLVRVADSLLGDLTAVARTAGCGNLAPAAWCDFQASRIVRPGDADPLSTTVAVTYSVDGVADPLEAWDEHTVELFQPAVGAVLVGTDQAQAGDPIDYTVTLSNHSSADSPPLHCSAGSSLTGRIFDGTLPLGDTVLHLLYAVQPGDPDPLHNTVTLSCSPDGFPNALQAEASQSVNLYQPAISLKMMGGALAHVGQQVSYRIELHNGSSPDTPPMDCLLVDSGIGFERHVTLSGGEQDVSLVPYIVPEAAPDPFVNTVIAACLPHGATGSLVESASWSTELFQARIAFDKTGDALSKRGGTVDYQIVLENRSSAEAPQLQCTLADQLLDLLKTVTLVPGESFAVTGVYQVLDDAEDPLSNIAVVTCTPVGYSQRLVGHASHTTRLFEPAIELAKTGDALSQPGEGVDYTISLRNASSPDTPDLACTISDPLLQLGEQVTLAPGEANTVSVLDYIVPLDVQAAHTNTAAVRCVAAGLPAIEAQATWVTALYHPALRVIKEGPAYLEVGDRATYSFVIANASSGKTPPLELIEAVDDKLGDLTQLARGAGCATLEPGEGTGAFCQFAVRYTVRPGDERGRDPASWPILVNTVTIRYLPGGSSFEVAGSGTHSIRLMHPGPDSTEMQALQSEHGRARPRSRC